VWRLYCPLRSNQPIERESPGDAPGIGVDGLTARQLGHRQLGGFGDASMISEQLRQRT
jgi:hypothetical protein